MSANLKKFLRAAINPDNLEANPILQDYMTPKLVDEIDGILAKHCIKR